MFSLRNAEGICLEERLLICGLAASQEPGISRDGSPKTAFKTDRLRCPVTYLVLERTCPIIRSKRSAERSSDYRKL
jgi:hypothetical protein